MIWMMVLIFEAHIPKYKYELQEAEEDLEVESGPPVAWRAWKRPLFSSAAPTTGSCLTMAMEEAGQDVINPFYAAALA